MTGEAARPDVERDSAEPPARSAACRIVWDPRFLQYNLGEDHPFTERAREMAVRLLRASLAAEPGPPVDWVTEVPLPERSSLERFHLPEYLNWVRRAGQQRTPGYLDTGDTPAFPQCYDAAGRIVEGALRGLEFVLERRRPAFHPAGGLHHAHPDRASGFCILNDAAVAIATALRQGKKVAYVDLDAHHGDGVMYGFYDSGRVLDIDFHQDGRTLFPGTGDVTETGRGDGAGSKVNVPLPPGAGDEALLPLFRRIVPPLLEEFHPDLLLVQHGVDGHAGDPLTGLQYTGAAYAAVDSAVQELAARHAAGRLLVTGGGGYSAASVALRLAAVGLVLAGRNPPAESAAVPAIWLDDFLAVAPDPAFTSWQGPPRPLRPSPWSADRSERLVRQIEAAIGRRLPASG